MMVIENKTTKVFSAGILVCASVFLSSPAFAEWKYVENIDPMTDENQSIAFTTHSAKESAAVRCDGNGDYDLIFRVGEYLNNDQRVPVQFRIDDNEASEERTWSLSTDGMSVFAPSRYKKELIEGLKKGSEFTIQITDYQGSRPFSKFSLEGSSAAINQLTCLPK